MHTNIFVESQKMKLVVFHYTSQSAVKNKNNIQGQQYF